MIFGIPHGAARVCAGNLSPVLPALCSSTSIGKNVFLPPAFFLIPCFPHLGIYTSYKTFLHKDKTLIKRLLKVSTSHSVLGGKTVPGAWFEQTELSRGAEFTVWDDLVRIGTRLSCQV